MFKKKKIVQVSDSFNQSYGVMSEERIEELGYIFNKYKKDMELLIEKIGEIKTAEEVIEEFDNNTKVLLDYKAIDDYNAMELYYVDNYLYMGVNTVYFLNQEKDEPYDIRGMFSLDTISPVEALLYWFELVEKRELYVLSKEFKDKEEQIKKLKNNIDKEEKIKENMIDKIKDEQTLEDI